jgi:hypothetical protein
VIWPEYPSPLWCKSVYLLDAMVYLLTRHGWWAEEGGVEALVILNFAYREMPLSLQEASGNEKTFVDSITRLAKSRPAIYPYGILGRR